ncbi:hypothetical protein GBAR_LOCUS25554, partial [Geodia barretti]
MPLPERRPYWSEFFFRKGREKVESRTRPSGLYTIANRGLDRLQHTHH